MSPRPVTLVLLRFGLDPVPVLADHLIEDVTGVDDVKLPADTAPTLIIDIEVPRVRLDTEEGTRDTTIGGDDVLNSFLLNRILA